MSLSENCAHSSQLIAIVDDEECVREAVASLLRSAGYLSEEFPSAEAFLARDDHDGIRCLILDLHLAGMDGLQLQESLMALRSSIPIVFVSADGLPAARDRALAAGAIAFLKKPFPDEVLLACVQAAIACRSNR